MSNNILTAWFLWHFYEVPRFLLGVWKNYIQFSIDFFSTSLLLRTLFSPWRRYIWGYPKGFDIPKILEALLSNIVSRILGAICRISLIILGAIFQIFVLIAGLVVFVTWLALPIITIIALIFCFGLYNL